MSGAVSNGTDSSRHRCSDALTCVASEPPLRLSASSRRRTSPEVEAAGWTQQGSGSKGPIRWRSEEGEGVIGGRRLSQPRAIFDGTLGSQKLLKWIFLESRDSTL